MPHHVRHVQLLARAAHPEIIPIPQRASGNNVPFSMKKTRRTWKPNKSKFDLPVNVLGGAAFLPTPEVAPGSTRPPRLPELKNVKMAVRDLRSLDKNGGVEGLLLTRPPSKLTPYGRQLRSELFAELHLIRDRLREAERQAQDEEIDRLAEEEALPIEAPASVEAQQTTIPQ